MILNGKLTYDKDGNYTLVSPGAVINISDILKRIYYADCNHINIKIMCGCKVLFNEIGNLYKKRDRYNLYSYYVNGFPLEETLFFNTDKDLEITLYAEALKGESYGTKFRAS